MGKKASSGKKKRAQKLTAAQQATATGRIVEILLTDRPFDDTLQPLVAQLCESSKFPFGALSLAHAEKGELNAVSGIDANVITLDTLGASPTSASPLTFDFTTENPAEFHSWIEKGVKSLVCFPVSGRIKNNLGILSLASPESVVMDKSLTSWIERMLRLLSIVYESLTSGEKETYTVSTPEETQRQLETLSGELKENKQALEKLYLAKENLIQQTTQEHEEWFTMQLIFRTVAEKAGASTDPAVFCAAVHAMLPQMMPALDFCVALLDGQEYQFPYFSGETSQSPGDVPQLKERLDRIVSTEEALFESFPGDKDSESSGASANWLGVPLQIFDMTKGAVVVSDPTALYTEREKEILQYMALQIANVMQKKHADEEYRNYTIWDELTLLPNSKLFPLLSSYHLANARRNKGFSAVLLLEIGRLDEVKATLGPTFSDGIVKNAAERILQKLREGDIAVRHGETSLLWSIPALRALQDAAVVAEKVLSALSRPIEMEGQSVLVKANIGMSLFPADGTDPETLVKKAEAALAVSRKSKGNSYRFFSLEMNEKIRARLLFKKELKEAALKKEFTLHYQPIVEIDDRRIRAVEPLIRWRKPQRGTLLPGEFLGLSEEVGLAANLDEWMIRTAMNQRQIWEKEGTGSFRLSVNLSSQFFWDGAAERFEKIFAETGQAPGWLEAEIKEKVLMKDAGKAASIMKEIVRAGVSLSIDDFGTGGLSLLQLKQFPVHAIKIDPSYIRQVSAHPGNVEALSAIISVAHSHDIQVVAEGVESIDELRLLQFLRCDFYQGLLFSPPLPRTSFTDFIGKQKLKRADITRPGEEEITQSMEAAVAANAADDPAEPVVSVESPLIPLEVPLVIPTPVISGAKATVTSPSPASLERNEKPHIIFCSWCESGFNAMDAPWCLCLTPDPSLECPSCRRCFCKAPLEYRHKVMDSAPDSFWERKRQYDSQSSGVPQNLPVEQAGRPLVLIVDNDNQILKTACRLVRGLGYSVIVARNGQEGLRLTKEYLPDLVLCDALIPKIDGREMCRLIKQDPKSAAVRTVVMTAYSGAAKYKTAILKEMQFDEHLQKPVEYERLRAVLQKFLH